MSVLVQTSYGDLTIDLFVDKCPTASKNFIKLCKLKHYNNSLFMNVQKDHLTQIKTSNPTTIYKQVFNDEDYGYFQDEIDMQMKMNKIGLICTINDGPNMNNSQFFITLTNNNLTSLYGKHTIYGQVQDGIDTLKKINQSIVDKTGRPVLNIRILHTHIIDDPFEDLPGMKQNVQSPIRQKDPDRLEVSQHLEILGDNKTQQEMIRTTKQQKAKKQAVTLQILGDLPDAQAKPPENILFVCKLNPITQEKDLQLIFSRYGNIKNCEIVRDWKTGQSLQYAFIQYETPQSCQEAYLKMQKAMIDNRRIQVDFCQSVQKLMPKFGKKQQKRYGQLRDGGRGQLVPKFRQGKEIYGQKSSKYDLVMQNRNRQRKYSPERRQRSRDHKQKNKDDREKLKDRRQTSRQKQKKKRYSSQSNDSQKRSHSREKRKKQKKSKTHKKHKDRYSSQQSMKHKSKHKHQKRQ